MVETVVHFEDGGEDKQTGVCFAQLARTRDREFSVDSKPYEVEAKLYLAPNLGPDDVEWLREFMMSEVKSINFNRIEITKENKLIYRTGTDKKPEVLLTELYFFRRLNEHPWMIDSMKTLSSIYKEAAPFQFLDRGAILFLACYFSRTGLVFSRDVPGNPNHILIRKGLFTPRDLFHAQRMLKDKELLKENSAFYDNYKEVQTYRRITKFWSPNSEGVDFFAEPKEETISNYMSRIYENHMDQETVVTFLKNLDSKLEEISNEDR